MDFIDLLIRNPEETAGCHSNPACTITIHEVSAAAVLHSLVLCTWVGTT